MAFVDRFTRLIKMGDHADQTDTGIQAQLTMKRARIAADPVNSRQIDPIADHMEFMLRDPPPAQKVLNGL